MTFVALPGPAFATLIVYVIACPCWMDVGPLFSILRSAVEGALELLELEEPAHVIANGDPLSCTGFPVPISRAKAEI